MERFGPRRRKSDDFTEWFWWNVDKSSECWFWKRALNSDGYGILSINGRSRRAHVVAHELNGGSVPEGRMIDHMCRQRACVNPSHLRVVTRKQNGENQGVRSDSTSGRRGVSWRPDRNKWQAGATHNGQHVTAGYYSDIKEADMAARRLRRELFTHAEEDAA